MNQQYALDCYLPTFSQLMRTAIEKATPKYGDMTQWNMAAFIKGFNREKEELKEAFEKFYKLDPEAFTLISKEAVDVANLCFMLWWRSTIAADEYRLMATQGVVPTGERY